MKLLNTNELVKLAIDNPRTYIEAELVLADKVAEKFIRTPDPDGEFELPAFGMRYYQVRTHFIYTSDGKTFFNEIADGEEQEVSPEEFAKLYDKRLWNIFQIVPDYEGSFVNG